MKVVCICSLLLLFNELASSLVMQPISYVFAFDQNIKYFIQENANSAINLMTSAIIQAKQRDVYFRVAHKDISVTPKIVPIFQYHLRIEQTEFQFNKPIVVLNPTTGEDPYNLFQDIMQANLAPQVEKHFTTIRKHEDQSKENTKKIFL